MGGQSGGREASILAVTEIVNYYDTSAKKASCQSLSELLKCVDKRILALKNSDGGYLKAGSTCVIILIQDRTLYWTSVGDSRAYLMRGKEFVQLTTDQNYRAVLKGQLKAGMISKTEYETGDKKGDSLINYLGIGNLSLIDYNVRGLPLQKGDHLMIASDGLYRMVTDEEISKAIREYNGDERTLSRLNMLAEQKAMNSKQGRDNLTAVLITIK